MSGRDWSEAVEIGIRRMVARSGNAVFSRQQIIEQELERIIQETGSRGVTPEMTLSRELQQLRDGGEIEFLARGQYRLLDAPFLIPHVTPSKCVFVIGSEAVFTGEPDRYVRFSPELLEMAAASVGQWIIYQEPLEAGRRGYYATAQVEQIVRDPRDSSMFLALLETGSFLEFGRDVTTRTWADFPLVEVPDAIRPQGVPPAANAIRAITDNEFDRILELGMVGEHELLPREGPNYQDNSNVKEERTPFRDSVERSQSLVLRKDRDRQFRKRILDVYDHRCAITGMRLINGGGRAETQAAHIRSVESGGPDLVVNGIALSGTVHWMFDRGLISLSDAGEVLLSKKINDTPSVEKLIFPDRLARLPSKESLRPHPRYLAWHREYHRFAG